MHIVLNISLGQLLFFSICDAFDVFRHWPEARGQPDCGAAPDREAAAGAGRRKRTAARLFCWLMQIRGRPYCPGERLGHPLWSTAHSTCKPITVNPPTQHFSSEWQPLKDLYDYSVWISTSYSGHTKLTVKSGFAYISLHWGLIKRLTSSVGETAWRDTDHQRAAGWPAEAPAGTCCWRQTHPLSVASSLWPEVESRGDLNN